MSVLDSMYERLRRERTEALERALAAAAWGDKLSLGLLKIIENTTDPLIIALAEETLHEADKAYREILPGGWTNVHTKP